MIKIGITGGIGSGKTLVSKIFGTLGIPVYDADQAAKNLMNTHPKIRAALLQHFGPQTYTPTGLDRSWLATQVFQDAEKLKQLNAIVHPVTIADAAQWFDHQTGPYALKEAALIFESGSNKDLDYVIGVSAPKSLRIQRTIERDAISAEAVELRIQRQMPEAEKMKACDFVIQNDGSQSLIDQVIQVHQQLLDLSKIKTDPSRTK